MSTCDYLNSQCLNVGRAVRTADVVSKVELDLVPADVETHRNHAYERLDSGRRLVVAGSETPSDILVIEHLHSVCTHAMPARYIIGYYNKLYMGH